jgi:hypothetical protein
MCLSEAQLQQKPSRLLFLEKNTKIFYDLKSMTKRLVKYPV